MATAHFLISFGG